MEGNQNQPDPTGSQEERTGVASFSFRASEAMSRLHRPSGGRVCGPGAKWANLGESPW